MTSQSGNFCGSCGFSNALTARFCRSCGGAIQSITSPPAIQGQSTITGQTGLLTGLLNNGQYQILSHLGKGGMGAVYKAKDLSLDMFVAIKEMSSSGLDPADIPQAVESFKREARMLAKLRHVHLPHVYAHFQDSITGRWCVVMDYIEGESLEEYLVRSSNHRASLNEVLKWGTELCDVLNYLHTRQPSIIFRDLKPANIMKTPDNSLYLIDFGIARFFQLSGTDTLALGSPGYAPPEQYKKAATSRSDIYALGATLHQLLTGDDPSDTPFQFEALTGRSVPELKGHPPLLTVLNELILQMVNIVATKRPDSVLAVKKGLQQIADSYTKPMSPHSRVSRAQSPVAPGAVAQSASYLLALQQVTLLYAAKDKPLALELEAHLQTTGLNLSVFHNDGSIPGSVITRSWDDRLRNSSVFIPLVSADLWSDQQVWPYVQKVVSTKQSAQVVPVLLRPCWLPQMKFEGLDMVLSKPITSFVGAAKESAWLDIVSRIVQTLQAMGSVYQPTPQTVVPVPSVNLPPSPSPTRQILPRQAPIAAPTYRSPQPAPSALLPSISAPPSSDEWEVTILLAPEDVSWIAPIARTFAILQRSWMSGMGVRFVVHQGADGLSGSLDEMKQRIADSRITLALISPDFLASEWMDCYDDLRRMLQGRGHEIIPVLLRDCEWRGGQLVPRNGAIGRVGNDAAWTELSKELRLVLEGYYPNEMPRQQRW